MKLPEELLQSLDSTVGFNRDSFIEAHNSGSPVTSIRINPFKVPAPMALHLLSDSAIQRIPWSEYGFYLSNRPSFTFDPLFHAGCYYVQEPSSMFLEQAVKQVTDLSMPLKVLDLCGAPGGKSTHLQTLISADSLLVSNEVMKTRAGVLKQNIIKWGCRNVVVTCNDPQHFRKLEGFFDLVVIDAPCSGSGLFRKDAEAINEWSLDTVALCCGRQKRIVSDAFAALKPGGVLIYSTCSYSKEENEEIADWVVSEFPMESIPLVIDNAQGVVETSSHEQRAKGYRFYPDRVHGEGFYMSCFLKTSGEECNFKAVKMDAASKKEKDIIAPWLQHTDSVFLKEHFIYALPETLVESYSVVKKALNVQYAGVAIGEIMKERLVPDHALALSHLTSDLTAATELDMETAIRYLQKADIGLSTTTNGWQLVNFQSYNLGWINALANRVNNYYPKELRILKQQDHSASRK
ncbi:MAG TPA: hypothetical protein VEZ55_05365 [Chitinophagaceae bacterium]|nr:hypothetical protein [Chitinophagaceae bacterium]